MSASAVLIIMALVLLFTAIYSVIGRERYANEFGQELKALIEEAGIVRKDLEAMLENAVLVSNDMVQSLDERLQRFEVLALEAAADKEPAVALREKKKRRSRLPAGIEEFRRAHPYIAVPRLYNEGFTIQEIAEILNRGQGEVKLILNLERKREVGS